MIYLVTFLIATLLFYASEKVHKKCKLFHIRIGIAPIFAFLAVLILSLLAGFRSASVGKDVTTYVISAFSRISSTTLGDLFSNAKLELGYEFLNYISSKICNDVHFLLFIIEFIIIYGFYYISKYYLNNKNITLAMCVFMLAYFNPSLNIVRQCLAISIYLIACRFLFEGKYVKYLIGIAFATLFHSSAIVAIIVLPIYIFLNRNKGNLKRTVLVIAAFSLLLTGLDKIIGLFSAFGFVSSKYVVYFGGIGNSSIVMQIIPRAPILFLGILFYKRFDKVNKNNHILFCFLIIDLILACMAPIIGDASRISLYFGVWQCIYVAELSTTIRKLLNNNLRFSVNLMFVIYFIAYWTYCFAYRNFAATYPYISDFFC